MLCTQVLFLWRVNHAPWGDSGIIAVEPTTSAKRKFHVSMVRPWAAQRSRPIPVGVTGLEASKSLCGDPGELRRDSDADISIAEWRDNLSERFAEGVVADRFDCRNRRPG